MQTASLLVAAGAVWTVGIIVAAVWIYRWRLGCGRVPSPELVNRGESGSEQALPADEKVADEASASSANRDLPASNVAEVSSPVDSPTALRYPYRAQQWAAPCVRGRLPRPDDFFRVECRELYDGGISFHSPLPIGSETLVISLGNRDTLVFMLARLLAQDVVADESGSPHLVECQFVRRVREDAGRWARALKEAPLAAIAS